MKFSGYWRYLSSEPQEARSLSSSQIKIIGEKKKSRNDSKTRGATSLRAHKNANEPAMRVMQMVTTVRQAHTPARTLK